MLTIIKGGMTENSPFWDPTKERNMGGGESNFKQNRAGSATQTWDETVHSHKTGGHHFSQCLRRACALS